jgi:hypothetical protein
MRVSDAEREAAAAELREHFASGRLTQDELDERLTAVFAAKTRGDLSGLFTDLPSAGHGRTAEGSGRASGLGSAGPGSAGSGPWGGGPFGTGPFGAGDWQARGTAFRASAGRTIARAVLTTAAIWVLLILGILGVFGIGTGRPIGIVLIVAAFALLRRLLFVIFGRRRASGRGRGCGPRRGRRF